jgi:hypothetical protein
MDSAMSVGLAKGAAAGADIGGKKVSMPKPEVELILPDYAPVIAGLVAGERFVLVGRPATLYTEVPLPSDWDVIGYDNRFLGTLRLPASFSPMVLVGDRLFGIERDDLEVESVAVYRITPRK